MGAIRLLSGFPPYHWATFPNILLVFMKRGVELVRGLVQRLQEASDQKRTHRPSTSNHNACHWSETNETNANVSKYDTLNIFKNLTYSLVALCLHLPS